MPGNPLMNTHRLAGVRTVEREGSGEHLGPHGVRCWGEGAGVRQRGMDSKKHGTEKAGRWLLGMTRLREEQGWAEDKITGREVVRHGEAAVVEGACKVLGLCRK